MSLWEHNLPSHALCFLRSKYYSWSALGLDGIYRKWYKYFWWGLCGGNKVSPFKSLYLSDSKNPDCIFHDKSSKPSSILMCAYDMKTQVKCRYKFWQYIHKHLFRVYTERTVSHGKLKILQPECSLSGQMGPQNEKPQNNHRGIIGNRISCWTLLIWHNFCSIP